MELKSASTRSGSCEKAIVTVFPADGKGTAAVPLEAQAGAAVAATVAGAGACVAGAGACVAGAGACVAGAVVAVAAGAQPAKSMLATITRLTRTNIIRFITLSSTFLSLVCENEMLGWNGITLL
jgi:hypothetical protein